MNLPGNLGRMSSSEVSDLKVLDKETQGLEKVDRVQRGSARPDTLAQAHPHNVLHFLVVMGLLSFKPVVFVISSKLF